MARKLKRIRGSDNVFSDLGFPPGEAANLKMRSRLMIETEVFYRRSGLTRAQAAKQLGIAQSRLDALLRGRIGQISLDALVKIATRAGLNVRLVIRSNAAYGGWRKRKPFPLKGSPQQYPKRDELYDRPIFRRPSPIR